MSKFGDRLKLLRNEKDLTQEELGNIFNVHKGTISKWENGINFPDEEILVKLSKMFEVSLDFLMGITEKRQPHHVTIEELKQLAPEHAWLFDKTELEYVELVEELRDKKIPPEAIKELVKTLKKHFNMLET